MPKSTYSPNVAATSGNPVVRVRVSGRLTTNISEESYTLALPPPSYRSQAYFWTPRWQAGEREALADIAAGRVREFDTMDEALDYLMSDED